jgi:hypothetical protein
MLIHEAIAAVGLLLSRLLVGALFGGDHDVSGEDSIAARMTRR